MHSSNKFYLCFGIIACYISYVRFSHANKIDDAMAEYRKEKDRKFQEELEQQRIRDELNKQHYEEEQRKSNDRLKRLKDVWSKQNPAGKYISRAVDKIENDKEVQQQLLDKIKSDGNTIIYFYGMEWPVGHFSKFINFVDIYDEIGSYEVFDNQIIHDDTLTRKVKIKSGPFIGWTFETYRGFLSPGFRLIKSSGIMDYIAQFFN